MKKTTIQITQELSDLLTEKQKDLNLTNKTDVISILLSNYEENKNKQDIFNLSNQQICDLANKLNINIIELSKILGGF